MGSWGPFTACSTAIRSTATAVVVALLAPTAPLVYGQGSCACTGDNVGLPTSLEPWSDPVLFPSEFGATCKAWDAHNCQQQYPNTDTLGSWCCQAWCYVDKECTTAERSWTGADLYWSYAACSLPALASCSWTNYTDYYPTLSQAIARRAAAADGAYHRPYEVQQKFETPWYPITATNSTFTVSDEGIKHGYPYVMAVVRAGQTPIPWSIHTLEVTAADGTVLFSHRDHAGTETYRGSDPIFDVTAGVSFPLVLPEDPLGGGEPGSETRTPPEDAPAAKYSYGGSDFGSPSPAVVWEDAELEADGCKYVDPNRVHGRFVTESGVESWAPPAESRLARFLTLPTGASYHAACCEQCTKRGYAQACKRRVTGLRAGLAYSARGYSVDPPGLNLFSLNKGGYAWPRCGGDDDGDAGCGELEPQPDPVDPRRKPKRFAMGMPVDWRRYPGHEGTNWFLRDRMHIRPYGFSGRYYRSAARLHPYNQAYAYYYFNASSRCFLAAGDPANDPANGEFCRLWRAACEAGVLEAGCAGELPSVSPTPATGPAEELRVRIANVTECLRLSNATVPTTEGVYAATCPLPLQHETILDAFFALGDFLFSSQSTTFPLTVTVTIGGGNAASAMEDYPADPPLYFTLRRSGRITMFDGSDWEDAPYAHQGNSSHEQCPAVTSEEARPLLGLKEESDEHGTIVESINGAENESGGHARYPNGLVVSFLAWLSIKYSKFVPRFQCT